MLLDGRRDESSSYQAKAIVSREELTETAHRLIAKPNKRSQKACGNCGGKLPHRGPYPAKGKTCRNCEKPNHFAAVCRRSKTLNPHKTKFTHGKKSTEIRPFRHDSDNSEDECMYAVGITKSRSEDKTPKVNITVGGYNFPILIDTGSTINVIERNTFNRIKAIKLEQTKVKAYPYNIAKPVQFLGKFEAVIQTKSRNAVASFFVLNEENSGCLLSASTAQEMGIVNLSLNKMTSDVTGKDGETEMKSDDQKINDIVQEYKAVFTGIGKLKGYSVKLNIC